MSIVRKIYKADWRALVVTVAIVETPKGRVDIRFMYDKASAKLFWAIPGDLSFHQLGLSRAKTDELLRRVKETCLWRIKVTEKARADREELKERRAKDKARKTSRRKKVPKEQQELPF